MAASWDRKHFEERAIAIADQFKSKRVRMWLGLVTSGPRGRGAMGGRNFEAFGSDPFLDREASFITNKSAQSNGLMAVAKHYIGYEQETYRNPHVANASVLPLLKENYERNIKQLPIDAIVDDTTLHETYLPSFEQAVRAGVASVMCGYNRINGEHACSNSYILNTVLKGELAFSGSVMSDWGGSWDTRG